MPRIFDPIRLRESFDKTLLKMELSMTAVGRPNLGGAAIVRLDTMVKAWLVGLQSEIRPALKDCHAWLKQSIETRESLGDIFIPAVRSGAFALTHWMLNNESDSATYLRSLDEFELHFKQGGQKVIDGDYFNKESQRFEPKIERGLPISDEEIGNGYLSDYLANCIQSDQFARGVSMYEKVGGELDPEPGRLKTIAEFGYWLCLQKTRDRGAELGELLSIGERAVRAHLQGPWLGHGQATRAATWLKILFWQPHRASTPIEVVLKAYNLMPNVLKPPFLSDREEGQRNI